MDERKILWEPNRGPQTAFLAATADEVLYGGAVGGGKTDAVLVWPLHRVHHPLHRSIILRRERKRLQEIIDRARWLYAQVDPSGLWHETELRWKWSTGAFTQFGHAEQEKDIEAFKSFEYDLVLFDELTEFTEWQYKFMFMRNRSKVEEFRPLMRSATNPGGDGMAWVDERFVGTQPDGGELFLPYKVYSFDVDLGDFGTVKRTRQRIPSTVFDNPKLPNREAYLAGLGDLAPEEKEAYLWGKWGIWKGQFFARSPREVTAEVKDRDVMWVRAMDYGFDPDPCCVLWACIYPKTGVVEIAHEIYERRLTTDSIAHMIQAVEKEVLRIRPQDLVASVASPDIKRKGPDQSKSVFDLLEEKGAWFVSANNDRIAGWAQVRRLLGRDTLRAWEGRAPNLLRTLPRLQRDPKKRDDIKQGQDHAAEALRYLVMAYVGGLESTPPPPQPDEGRRDPHWERVQKALEESGTGYIPGLGSGW